MPENPKAARPADPLPSRVYPATTALLPPWCSNDACQWRGRCACLRPDDAPPWPPQVPRNHYGVVLADPPWTFATYSGKGKGRSAESHYDCLTLDQIKALPVGSWAAMNAVLYLWATVPHLESALAVMAAWGFTYRSGFVWVKERIGTGYWARNRHEHLLIGARGAKVCPTRGRAVDSVIEGQQRLHSQKPDRAVEIIERYHPNVAKLEMFARECRPGWDAWGDEVGLLDNGPVETRRWPSQGAGVGVVA